MPTTTTSRLRGGVRISVERRGERSVVRFADGQVPLAARSVRAPRGWARVVLVQSVAGLLGGDEVEIDVEVGEGAALEVIANAATVVYPAELSARCGIRCRVGAGGRLAWMGQPTILTSGSGLDSSIDIDLRQSAIAFVRESLILGRYGEEGGRVNSTLRCELEDEALLSDRILIDNDSKSSRVQFDGARAYLLLGLLGARARAPVDHNELHLSGPGGLMRILGSDAAEMMSRSFPAENAYLGELRRGFPQSGEN